MKTCPFCAEDIQDAAIVCKHCGRDLPSTSGAEQSTRPENAASRGHQEGRGPTNTCPFCGQERKHPTMAFCPSCGRDIPKDEVSPRVVSRGAERSVPKPQKADNLKLAPGRRRIIAVVSIALGFSLTFVPDAAGLPFFLMWFGLAGLFVGQPLPRFGVAFCLAVLAMIPGVVYVFDQTRQEEAEQRAVEAEQEQVATEERQRHAAEARAKVIEEAAERFPSLRKGLPRRSGSDPGFPVTTVGQ